MKYGKYLKVTLSWNTCKWKLLRLMHLPWVLIINVTALNYPTISPVFSFIFTSLNLHEPLIITRLLIRSNYSPADSRLPCKTRPSEGQTREKNVIYSIAKQSYERSKLVCRISDHSLKNSFYSIERNSILAVYRSCSNRVISSANCFRVRIKK